MPVKLDLSVKCSSINSCRVGTCRDKIFRVKATGFVPITAYTDMSKVTLVGEGECCFVRRWWICNYIHWDMAVVTKQGVMLGLHYDIIGHTLKRPS